MTTIHAELLGDKAIISRVELEILLELARRNESIELVVRQEDISTSGLTLLAEQGGAFDFLNEEEGLYTVNNQYQEDKRRIERETDAEIALGIRLEQARVDCDAFREQWQINPRQFNRISHYLYGLTDTLPELPPAFAVLLMAGRQQHSLTA